LNLADEDLSDEENQVTIIMTRDEHVVACVMLKIMDKDIIKLRQMAVDDGQRWARHGVSLCHRQNVFAKRLPVDV
jgi:N-acetylglutamate synthase-like GNAT family acetyltransferase